MKFSKVLFTFVSLFICSQLFAQTVVQNTSQPQVDKVTPDSIVIPDEFVESLNEIVHNWYLQNATLAECSKDTGFVTYPDEVYSQRLQKLPYVMEMPYNSIVRSLIEVFAKRHHQVEYMLGIGETYYFPIFEAALARYNVPLELKYLPVIESALNARAISKAGAGGLWQFMVSTGRIYGLEVNSLVDERCDPVKSSDAAARYLRDLYNIYQDWHLVIAAYNCGPGNVAKAMRYSGGKKDYWQIYPYLPRETRGYVPIFIAANYIMNYYKYHNMCPVQPNITVATDTMMVDTRINLQQVAEVLDISIEELRFLNPQYRQDIIPGNIKPYPLVLPFNQITAYIDNKDSIAAHRAAELVPQRTKVEPLYGGSSVSGSGEVVYYKVRSGDTLGGIAARYRVTVAQIKKWNGLRGSMIRTGQRLKIYRK
ncbi:MAG TPA: transglycosylase SLT domain-containing protein [Paludibacteraceae bacterium]|nr:transglycosylase SLT domain-containing protein [Paludibacteraceae bacterium]HQB68856.1 transglycosylase SLT domain-containing protein [Paludibacteraceae bacterium]HRS68014.1 transglycosylase SLT domain-containing protein [Paludibacteraceae bacterium]